MASLFEKKFEKMLLRYRDVVGDKRRFTALIKDLFPEEIRNINLLLAAYDIGIVEDIETVSSINNAFAFKYVKKLMDDYGISRLNADWVVSTWCVCYGEKVLKKKSDIKLQENESELAILDEKADAKKIYNDNFAYTTPVKGCVGIKGFSGLETSTVILPNRYGNYVVNHVEPSAFEETKIEEAIFTDGYKDISERLFAGCYKLHQVIIPFSVNSIQDGAFTSCVNLKSISLPENLEEIGDDVFEGAGLRTIILPKSIRKIGTGIFRGCNELNNVIIPSNIKEITEEMFMDCKSLKKITLHEEMIAIQKNAFKGCESLDYIIIPDSVTEIGEDAFTGTDKQFIVQCSFGSFAEQYCRKNKIKYQLV